MSFDFFELLKRLIYAPKNTGLAHFIHKIVHMKYYVYHS